MEEEERGIFSPIMPSGAITPVTFRNLTFSPGGAEKRRRRSERQLSLPLPWLLLLPPTTAQAPDSKRIGL